MQLITRAAVKRLAVLFAALLLAALGAWFLMMRMPGRSFAGPLPPLSPAQAAIAADLRRDVEMLAGRIGLRNLSSFAALERAAAYVESRLKEAGYADVASETFPAGNKTCRNVSVEIRGTSAPNEIVVIGGHYDSVLGSPGANDNATGTAAVIALARRFAHAAPARTLRFVAFANEEPPHFQTYAMGSRVCARNCRLRGENVVAMVSLETIGFFSDVEGSQQYPPPLSLFYSSTGNFIGFVGNVASRELVRRAVGAFRRTTSFPSEAAALPSFLPGVGWSDHWAFWQEGYPAIMVTDTAPFRYPHYHGMQDTPDKIDYERCARVVGGLGAVVADLGGSLTQSE
jgi:Peptidase family M28